MKLTKDQVRLGRDEVKHVAKLVDFKLKLRGQTAVYIDWANVYGWRKSLKREVNPQKLYNYLKNYKEIKQISFYYGEDKHPKSKQFLGEAKKIGYHVTTKPVKYIQVAEVDGQKIYRRKCDFDMEICIDAHKAIKEGFEGFIFFTGDGDFEPLYKLLIEQRKQAIVIYAKGHIGREIWEMKKGLFKAQISHLGL